MESSPLAIVGMRRSGTSSVSLALNRLGISFGPETELFKADQFNEEGYWEHKALAAIHRHFRMSLNLVSSDCDPVPPTWKERPATELLLARAQRCLAEQFLPIAGPWAWKDPDASLALPFVYEVSGRLGFEPHVLICVRNPYDTAMSEARRRGKPEIETVGSWLAHTLTALWDSRSHRRTVVMFSDLLEEPRSALAPTLLALGVEPTEATWAAVSGAIRPELVHSNTGLDALQTYPALVGRVYELCIRAARGIDPAFEAEIEACWIEFDGYRRMFWRPRLEEAALGVLWEFEGRSQVVQTSYRPVPEWQSLSIPTGAASGSKVQLYLYPLPAVVWIRRVAWNSPSGVCEAILEQGASGNLHERHGLRCVNLLHGPDQLVLTTPAGPGPFTLEIEFLVESSNLVIGVTYKSLSELCRKHGPLG